MVVIPGLEPNGAHADPDRGVEVLIIDRQPLFLAALASLLSSRPLRAHVQTEIRSDAGLTIVRARTFDLLLCELRAEPVSGIELAKVVADERLGVPVVLLGDDGDEQQLAAALTSSAAGFFTKSAGVDELIAGVQAVVSGHRAVGARLMARLLDQIVAPYPPHSRTAAHQLSPTELEILAMIGAAHSIPAIAASRGISHKTVRNHLAKIYRKLDLHGRTEAMLFAARMGLTSN